MNENGTTAYVATGKFFFFIILSILRIVFQDYYKKRHTLLISMIFKYIIEVEIFKQYLFTYNHLS